MTKNKQSNQEEENKELAIARINTDHEKERVEHSKNWLAEWYKKRLPVIGKEHLQPYVDKGLETRYQVPSQKQLTDPRDFIVLEEGVLGQYVRPLESTKTLQGYSATLQPRIALSRIWDGTPVHEFNHSIHFGGGNEFIPDFTNGKTGTYDDPYLSQPWEQHSRIMELRYLNRLDPLKTNYNIEDLNALRDRMRINASIIQELKTGGMSDQDIINALNTWASNTNNPFEKENGMLAASGGKLNHKKSYNKGDTLNYFNFFK